MCDGGDGGGGGGVGPGGGNVGDPTGPGVGPGSASGGNIGGGSGGSGGYGYSGGYDPGQISPGDAGSSATPSGQSSGNAGNVAGGVDAMVNDFMLQDYSSTPIVNASQLAAEEAEQAALTEAAIASAQQQADQQTDSVSKAKAFITALVSALGSMVFGSLGGMIAGKLAGWGMNTDTANAVIGLLSEGYDAESVIDGLSSADFGGNSSDGNGPTGGGPADVPTPTGGATDSPNTPNTPNTGGTNNDPTSYSFWDKFVDEWNGKNAKSAKELMLENDAFIKNRVGESVGNYQAQLADLTNQAKTGTGAYKPITFGMGNFRSSFVPKSGLMTANNIADYANRAMNSSLALTDVEQPNKANLDYLEKLKALAQWQYEMKQAKDLAEKGIDANIQVGTYQPDDKGTWLDAIKDFVQIGDTVGDAFSKYF